MKIVLNFLKLALLPACFVVLSACGGGGSSGSGNTTNSISTSPDKPVITSSASVARTGQSINFSGSSTAVNNLPLTYSWDFGDEANDTGAATSHTYATKGTYTVTLTITDNIGQSSATTFSIQVYAPPTTPTITPSNSTANIGQSVSFTGSSTDPNGLALTYSWDFGDGGTGTGATIAHTFSANGPHTITLTVSDSAGLTASATTGIQIYAPPGTPAITSSATLVTVGHYYSFTGTTVTFGGVSTDPNGLALTYAWNFGDGGSATGATTAHAYSVNGTYTVTLTATDSAGLSSTSTISILIYAPPTTPTITPSINSPDAGQSITFTGTATDPNSLALTYAWNFGDGGTGTGISAVHTYDAVGTYTVTLTITNSVGLTSHATRSVQVYARPVKPAITSSPSLVNTGQSVTFTGTTTDPNNRLVSYAWNFGDGGTGSGISASHTYATAGIYTVTFTVTDIAGISASTTYSQSISSPTDNNFVPDCTGTNCSASSPTAYTGSGTGVWRYNNTTGSTATIDINIGGVSAGKTVTMLFSNGSTTAAASLPATGVLATPVILPPLTDTRLASVEDADHQQQDSNHLKMLVENLKLSSELSAPTPSSKSIAGSLNIPPPPPPMPTPAVGNTRSWKEFAFDNKNYLTTAKAVCSVPNGRNVVIWVDSSYGNTVLDSDITTFANAYCGSTGGYARLATLMGDAWGAVTASQSTYLISDSPTKQDINIVIVASTTNYGGYFWGMNNYLSSSYSNSNEALVFFINGNGLHASLNYYMSALLHESAHMINYYQRAVMRSSYHDTWLEETSAMMSEDIVTPAVLGGYNTISSYRVPGYVNTGGAVSYVSWPQLSSNNYAMGGAFGGYLNRRYGISIFEQLISNCNAVTSYTCLDTLIKNHGGPGFTMDFARFGASIFAGLPAAGMPTAYAYPAKTDGGYTLAAINVPTNAPATATALSTFTATTHTYKKDIVASGYTSYVRTGVVVPANTTLIVVVK